MKKRNLIVVAGVVWMAAGANVAVLGTRAATGMSGTIQTPEITYVSLLLCMKNGIGWNLKGMTLVCPPPLNGSYSC